MDEIKIEEEEDNNLLVVCVTVLDKNINKEYNYIVNSEEEAVYFDKLVEDGIIFESEKFISKYQSTTLDDIEGINVREIKDIQKLIDFNKDMFGRIWITYMFDDKSEAKRKEENKKQFEKMEEIVDQIAENPKYTNAKPREKWCIIDNCIEGKGIDRSQVRSRVDMKIYKREE